MNKICFLLAFIAAIFFASCSSDYEFSGKNPLQISSDEIFYKIDGEYLSLYLEYPDDADVNILWIIDGDTINRNPYKAGYGKHFIKLVFIDIWGDAWMLDTTLFIKEQLGISLLSPVSNFCFPENHIVEFQYEINGTDKEEARENASVYICEEETCNINSSWQKLDSDSIELSKSIYWRIMVHANQDTVFSRIRKICIEE